MSTQTTNSVTTNAVSHSVQTAVDRSDAARGKKPLETPEQLQARLQKQQEEHSKLPTHFLAFPRGRMNVMTVDGRDKVVMNNDKGVPDPKRSATIEAPMLVVMPGTRATGEGNCGEGEYAPERGDSKFNIILGCGTSEEKGTLPPQIAQHQKLFAELCVSESNVLLGRWFDTTAEKNCEGGYSAAMDAARGNLAVKAQVDAVFAAANGLVGVKNAADVDKLAMNPANENLRKLIKSIAREEFIAKGKKPFGENKSKTGEVMAPVMFVQRKVWSMKKGAYKPGMPKNRPKGPKKTAVESDTANMSQLKSYMDTIGYKHNPIQYEERDPKGKRVPLQYPKVLVPKKDAFGNVVNDKDGHPIMVSESNIMFNPLFVITDPETGEEQHVRSMVSCQVSFGLTNGGVKNLYGVTAILNGPLLICRQDPVSATELYQYDPSFATGTFRKRQTQEDDDNDTQQEQDQNQENDDDNDNENDDDNQENVYDDDGAQDAHASLNAPVTTTGLIGVVQAPVVQDPTPPPQEEESNKRKAAENLQKKQKKPKVAQ